jgi:hypothetical protein
MTHSAQVQALLTWILQHQKQLSDAKKYNLQLSVSSTQVKGKFTDVFLDEVEQLKNPENMP